MSEPVECRRVGIGIGAAAAMPLLALVLGGCPGHERPADRAVAETRGSPAGEAMTERPAERPRAEPDAAGTDRPVRAETVAPDTCRDRAEAAASRVGELLDATPGCAFDVDCAEVQVSASCLAACPVALPAGGLRAFREAVEEVDRRTCAGFQADGCALERPSCPPRAPRCEAGRCAMAEGGRPDAAIAVPDENRADRREPPPRPDAGDASERASRLLEAIVRDDPDLARDFFFPLEAFREVKGIADPDAYWRRLFDRYLADIHALHASLPDLDRAEFDRLEIVRRGGFVLPGEEANRLPYWAARHNRLHYRVDGQPRSFEVRVLITWGTRWYVTHLSEFH